MHEAFMWLGVRDGVGFFPPVPSRSVRLSCPRPTEVKVSGFREASPPASARAPSNALAPNSSTIIHFGREQCQRSPFGQWLRKKGRPKDIPGQEKQSEIPPPARGSRNELAGLEVPVTLVTELGKSQEHLFREQGVHLVRRTALASIYVLESCSKCPFSKRRPQIYIPDRKIMPHAVSQG